MRIQAACLDPLCVCTGECLLEREQLALLCLVLQLVLRLVHTMTWCLVTVWTRLSLRLQPLPPALVTTISSSYWGLVAMAPCTMYVVVLYVAHCGYTVVVVSHMAYCVYTVVVVSHMAYCGVSVVVVLCSLL